MSVFRPWGERLDVWLETPCLVCADPWTEQHAQGLCPLCAAELAAPAPAPLRLAPGFEVHGLWAYRGAARRLVLQAKEDPHGPLGRWLVPRLRHLDARWTEARWVAVPGARGRRGRFLPALLVRASGRRASELRLRRLAERPAQAGLDGRQRRENLTGNFVARVSGRLRGAHAPTAPLILFDDVCTTGATLLETARALDVIGRPVHRGLVLTLVE